MREQPGTSSSALIKGLKVDAIAGGGGGAPLTVVLEPDDYGSKWVVLQSRADQEERAARSICAVTTPNYTCRGESGPNIQHRCKVCKKGVHNLCCQQAWPNEEESDLYEYMWCSVKCREAEHT